MTVDRTAFGALAVACVIAAGGGAYLAIRQSDRAPSNDQAVAAAAGNRNLPAEPAQGVVAETESVIIDSPSAAATESAASDPIQPSSQGQSARPIRTNPRAVSDDPRAGAAGSGREGPVAQSGARTSAPTAGEGAQASGLDRPWPSRAASEAVGAPAPPPVEPEPTALPVADAQPVAPEPPERSFEELVVPADSVIGLQIETTLTSETARVEDRVQARVTRDVKVDDQIAIPAGSRAEGSIALVDRGGKFKERARLGIRFHTLVLADGTRLTLNTETVFRDGLPPSGESAAKVGGAAVGGAILGAIFGGTRGAVVGGTVGAASGTAAVMAGDRNAATLPAGAMLTVRLTSPVTVTIEK